MSGPSLPRGRKYCRIKWMHFGAKKLIYVFSFTCFYSVLPEIGAHWGYLQFKLPFYAGPIYPWWINTA